MPAVGHKRVLAEGRSGESQSLSLARLLKRVFELDLEPCPNCDGELKSMGGDPGAAGGREDPHAPGIAGQGAATLSCPRSIAASGLTIPIHRSSCGPSPGPRGLAAPGLLEAAELESGHFGKPTIQAAGMRLRTGSRALGRSPSSTKTPRRDSTDACWLPRRGPSATNSALERLILRGGSPQAGSPACAPAASTSSVAPDR